MSRIVVLTATCALLVAATAPAETEYFRWWGKHVGCAINHAFARCDSGVDRPPGLIVHASGAREPVHTHGRLYSGHEPELSPGHSIRRGAVSCHSTIFELTCIGAGRRGFLITVFGYMWIL